MRLRFVTIDRNTPMVLPSDMRSCVPADDLALRACLDACGSAPEDRQQAHR